jgi:hypothetical protein
MFLGGLVELQLGDVRVSGLLGWFCSSAFLKYFVEIKLGGTRASDVAISAGKDL